jgi:hypothetical protein
LVPSGSQLKTPAFLAGVAVILAMASASCSMPFASQGQVTPSSSRPTAAGPEIWFAPFPPNHGPEAPGGAPRIGSLDYADLFSPDSAWSTAAAHVNVFKFYAPYLESFASDDELRRAFADLKRRGIGIAWEAGPLTPGTPSVPGSDATPCGAGIEGFGGDHNITIAQRIKRLGGQLSVIAMDEPFSSGTLYSGPRSCHWTAAQVAQQIADFIKSMRSVFPNVMVGDIEVDHESSDVVASWLAAFHDSTGDALPFLQWDIDWAVRTWPDRALEVETYARSHGTKFGMIYNGQFAGESDLDWIRAAERRMAVYEMEYGGKPDQAVFQSWNDRPRGVLPATQEDRFTHLIDRYFQTRTRLKVEVGATAANGSRQVSGKLTTAAGAPVANSPLSLTATPLDGRGVLYRYVLTGVTPAAVRQGLIQLDLEGWTGGKGAIDVHFTSVSYRQGGESKQRVPNSNFAQGMLGWGVSDPVHKMVTLSRSGLDIATRGPVRHGYINSSAFAVTPGATFRVESVARVSVSSLQSGQFVVIFGSTREISRSWIDFEAASSTQLAASGPDGTVAWKVSSLGSKRIQVSASWSGDATQWPAFADATD